MSISMKVFVLVTLFILIESDEHQSTSKDTFEEELFLKPLPNGNIYSYFQFTTKLDVSRKQQLHYRLFPKSLAEILEKYNVYELHLSLTQGQWKHKFWGYPVVDAPAGVQLWVWFDHSTLDVDKNWFGLSNALSGLFCASLNFIDKSNTVTPHLSFRPSGVTAENEDLKNSSFIRYASLPREIVCTENLTPWKKLLPCGTAAGLAALLNARQLFDVQYHSLAINFRHICKNLERCDTPSWELGESLSIVTEPIPIQRGKQDWSLKRMFASKIFNSCPLATVSNAYVDLSNNYSGNHFHLSPQPSTFLTNGRNVPLAFYNIIELNISPHNPLNIMATYDNSLQYTLVPAPVLFANRYIKGIGRGSGVIQCQIYYSKLTSPLKIVYLEQIPHYARVYAHTLKIISNNRELKADYLHISERKSSDEPFLMEAVITLPPNSLTTITLEFERSFLKFGAYPPDANHGFYIGSAVISTYLETSRNYTSASIQQSGLHPELFIPSKRYFLRLHTEILLLVLPTPDFSMPYNVICLVCTVVALAFGPLHNITTKRLVAENPKNKENWLGNLKTRLPWKRVHSNKVVPTS